MVKKLSLSLLRPRRGIQCVATLRLPPSLPVQAATAGVERRKARHEGGRCRSMSLLKLSVRLVKVRGSSISPGSTAGGSHSGGRQACVCQAQPCRPSMGGYRDISSCSQSWENGAFTRRDTGPGVFAGIAWWTLLGSWLKDHALLSLQY